MSLDQGEEVKRRIKSFVFCVYLKENESNIIYTDKHQISGGISVRNPNGIEKL